MSTFHANILESLLVKLLAPLIGDSQGKITEICKNIKNVAEKSAK